MTAGGSCGCAASGPGVGVGNRGLPRLRRAVWLRAAMQRLFPYALAGLAWLLGGCGRQTPAAEQGATPPVELTRVRFQLDGDPQIEAGGYFLAQARGFYRAGGLEVEIISGGPGGDAKEQVAAGSAELGATDGNCVIAAVSRGRPLVIVGAEMQRSPLGLMFHHTRPLRSFRDLDGRTLIANTSMVWVDFLQRSQRVRFDRMPYTADLTGFIADESLVRQCFVTQEPFVTEQRGAKVGFLLVADSGFDPYRVIYANRAFAARHPEAIRRFLAATVAGYNELIEGDPTPAFAAIAAANPAMAREVMEHGLAMMRELRLVQGRREDHERTGRIVADRIAGQIEQLRQFNQLARPVAVDEVARFDLVPVEDSRPTERIP